MRADLALAGFGHVGRRFAHLIAELAQTLHTDHDLQPRIVGIATRRHGSVFAAEGVDIGRALADVSAGRRLGEAGEETSARVIQQLAESRSPLRVLVETTTLAIADGQPAIRHIESALDRGCHAITANKGPVAFAYRSLQDRAARAGVSFLFEGAVMDGVPIFNLVRETLPVVRIVVTPSAR